MLFEQHSSEISLCMITTRNHPVRRRSITICELSQYCLLLVHALSENDREKQVNNKKNFFFFSHPYYLHQTNLTFRECFPFHNLFYSLLVSFFTFLLIFFAHSLFYLVTRRVHLNVKVSLHFRCLR